MAEELISEKEVREIWNKVGMEKEINNLFGDKDKIEITKKELTDYTIKILKVMVNTWMKEMLEKEKKNGR